MPTNPRNVLKSFNQMDAQRKEDDLLGYQYKVACRVVAARGSGLEGVKQEYYRVRADRPELFLEAVKSSPAAAFPQGLYIDHRHAIKFDALALRAQDSYWFRKFLEMASGSGEPSAGVIFPVMGRGDWIIHNMPVSPRPGRVRLMILSAADDIPSVHITTLEQFLEEWKR